MGKKTLKITLIPNKTTEAIRRSHHHFIGTCYNNHNHQVITKSKIIKSLKTFDEHKKQTISRHRDFLLLRLPPLLRFTSLLCAYYILIHCDLYLLVIYCIVKIQLKNFNGKNNANKNKKVIFSHIAPPSRFNFTFRKILLWKKEFKKYSRKKWRR